MAASKESNMKEVRGLVKTKSLCKKSEEGAEQGKPLR